MEGKDRMENRSREKKRMKPPPLSSGSTFTTYFLCVCSLTNTFTYTQSSRHGVHRVETWHSIRCVKILFLRRSPLDRATSIKCGARRDRKAGRKFREINVLNIPWDGREEKKNMKDIKRGKNSSHAEWCGCHLWRAAPYFISFPAQSDNQCHIFV